VHWGDVVMLTTPIRWGAASSLFYKMAERLNCVQNQITIRDRVLIRNKVAGQTFRRDGGRPARPCSRRGKNRARREKGTQIGGHGLKL
jgi:hypothetical protein